MLPETHALPRAAIVPLSLASSGIRQAAHKIGPVGITTSHTLMLRAEADGVDDVRAQSVLKEGAAMEGRAHSIVGADGVTIGLLTAGAGPRLLLVHGGMGSLERWQPLWSLLVARWQVTAMDRRGRRSSGDSEPYALTKEFDDVVAVATALAEDGGAIDVFGHSYGATCVLGAAARGALFRRIALYEPPGPATVPREWVERVTALISNRQPGRAMFSFLTEIIGLGAEQIEELKVAPGAHDVLATVTATMPREAQALTNVDLCALAMSVAAPVLLLLGATSPAWAGEIARYLLAALPNPELVILAGQGHEAVNNDPVLIFTELQLFLASSP